MLQASAPPEAGDESDQSGEGGDLAAACVWLPHRAGCPAEDVEPAVTGPSAYGRRTGPDGGSVSPGHSSSSADDAS